MSKYRIPKRKSKYFLPKQEYLTAIHYSLRYPSLLAEYNILADTAKGITYDTDKVQTSSDYNSTEEAGIKLAELKAKLDKIEQTIKETTEELAEFLKLGVCYDFTFEQLKGNGMPCERAKYYDMRREYLFRLAEKI